MNPTTLPLNFYLLDAARAGVPLAKAQEINPAYSLLYDSAGERYLKGVAPYVFSLPREGAFGELIFEGGWGEHWGVYVHAPISLTDAHHHFRKFTKVRTEDGEESYFRFYDPRVLKVFLPSCDRRQIVDFFGPIEYFVTEGDSPEECIVFRQRKGVLEETRTRIN